MKQWYKVKREERMAYSRKYHKNNKNKDKEYRRKNRDKIRAKRKLYYKNNKDKEKQYFENNKDKIKATLKKKGKPIPENDIWIAAIAINHDFTLITRDKHFDEIDTLLLQKW